MSNLYPVEHKMLQKEQKMFWNENRAQSDMLIVLLNVFLVVFGLLRLYMVLYGLFWSGLAFNGRIMVYHGILWHFIGLYSLFSRS